MGIIGTFILIIIASALFLIPVILYLLTLQNTLKKVKKKIEELNQVKYG